MNRVLFIVVAVLAFGLSAHSASQLVWLSHEHNFGAFSEDLDRVHCTFKAVNTGSEPVGVVSVRSNCGCAVPSYNREPVAPGDTLTIEVVYNASGRPGRFSKKVYVDTSDGSKATMFVKGTVVGNQSTIAGRYPIAVGKAHINNKIVAFGSTVKGHTLLGGINIYNSANHPIVPVIESLPPYITATAKPQVIGIGEQGFISLRASTSTPDHWGTVTGSFRLIPDSASRADSVRVSTVMIVKEDFNGLSPEQLRDAPQAKFSTESVDFGRIEGSKAVKRLFVISNLGHSPLIIRRIDTASDAITVIPSTTKIPAGKEATVSVVLNPSEIDPAVPLNARATFIVNDPSRPMVAVRFVGTH